MKGLKFPKTVRMIHIAPGFDRSSHLAVKFKVLMMDECRWHGFRIPPDLEDLVNRMRKMTWEDAVEIVKEAGVDVAVNTTYNR